MRFKKGSRVEVLTKIDVRSGAWHSAEIICGNGHYYTVKYESYVGFAGEIERVSRKNIRPCPPLEISELWACGDVVEVLENFSWKMAAVAKVLGEGCFLVRLLGSSSEFRVSKFAIRARRSWQDDEWILIGKGSGSVEGKNDEALVSSQIPRKKLMIKLNLKDEQIPLENKVNFNKSNVSSFKRLNRRRCSQVKPNMRTAQKFRAVEKDGKLHRTTTAADQTGFYKQVDVVSFPRKSMQEKYNNILNENRPMDFSEMDAERRKQSGATDNSVTSSTGSCSIGTNGFCYVSSSPVEDNNNGSSSDAESFCGSRCEEKVVFFMRKDLDAEMHRLELQRYRCTIERLHKSGPMTWEQEAWITNLRLSLNISNDEHLTEIRNLISADNSLSLR